MKKISFNENWLFEGKTITLPHDAMIHRARQMDAQSGSAQAYFPGGEYVYEKTFIVEGELLNARILFEFEGVYKNAKVFINGKEAGGCDYGYLPFFVETENLLHEGENAILVECDNLKQPDSRWYSGAGIFRPVWMHVGTGDVILPESVKISTVSLNPAVIRIESKTAVNAEIFDVDTVVARGNGTAFELEIPNAKLWDEDNPYL